MSVDERQRTASYHPRVPHVTEAAVAGDVALIGGYPAWFLHQVVEATKGGLEATLARSGVPLRRREGVLRAWQALGEVGGRWRLEQALRAANSGSGTAEPRAGESPLGSTHVQSLSTAEAAVVLGVTPRWVVKLATAGVLARRREHGGRWLFAAADVAAEQARRAAREAA